MFLEYALWVFSAIDVDDRSRTPERVRGVKNEKQSNAMSSSPFPSSQGKLNGLLGGRKFLVYSLFRVIIKVEIHLVSRNLT